ncbi:MAG: prepilin-type N-terminal cleavage/methylation domain-containing protein [Betaproteobacteria bacterium]|nr:MAG: prepilin-type N-terminal cleavage/methylation domain-containing protein [Betaproteobacteria bacterium]
MRKQAGFTLIELLMVLVIIGILAAVAVPQYSAYTKKAKFSEVVAATAPVKMAIEICLQKNGAVASCDTDAKVGADLTAAAIGGYVGSVTITGTTAAIVATGDSTTFGSVKTHTLTPTVSGGAVTWTAACSDAALC